MLQDVWIIIIIIIIIIMDYQHKFIYLHGFYV